MFKMLSTRDAYAEAKRAKERWSEEVERAELERDELKWFGECVHWYNSVSPRERQAVLDRLPGHCVPTMHQWLLAISAEMARGG